VIEGCKRCAGSRKYRGTIVRGVGEEGSRLAGRGNCLASRRLVSIEHSSGTSVRRGWDSKQETRICGGIVVASAWAYRSASVVVTPPLRPRQKK